MQTASTAAASAISALSSESSKASQIESSAKLPKPSQSLLDNFWVRMGALYGHTWTSQFGVHPDGLAADTWATALAGVTPSQVAHGMREALAAGGEFPPSAPRFRAMCFGIPSFAQTRLAVAAKECSPFVRQVWSNLDTYRFSRADQSHADRMLKDAYELARDHVMRGGELPPDPVAEIEAPKATPRRPAPPDVVRAACSQLEALLGPVEGAP